MSDEIVMSRGGRYAVVDCGNCGVAFAVPERMWAHYRAAGGFAHCPNGHRWGFRTGTEQAEQDRLRLERDRLKQSTARLEEEIAAERARADAAERRVAQVRKRAAAGVCPCCSRSFTNVRRHMASKHPNVVALECKVPA